MALITIMLATACSDGDADRMLPPVATSGSVPTGDPAGPADRGATRVQNPYAGDPAALRDGEHLYRQMNCADCHRYSGTGGMGPSLVDGEWLFGDTPVDRFKSVHGGRARGMPSYGDLLPDESIWKVVAYIEDLHRSASAKAGRAGGGPSAATRQAQQPAAPGH